MASTAGAATRSTKSKTMNGKTGGAKAASGRAASAKAARPAAAKSAAASSAKSEATASAGVAKIPARSRTEGMAGAAPEMREGLNELFVTMLKDIYYAEKQILKSLPRMAKAAKSDELKQGFEQHREETAGQIERLEQVFAALGQKPKAEQCEAIQGILEEGKEVMEDFKGKPALDVGLCGAGKAVEHYEIARYSAMKTLAQHLGMKDAARLIDANLAEEIKTDKLLDQCAQTVLMSKAA
jgi:ferritin-like metal-binding protein YciE